MAPVLCVPLTGSLPLQSPEAVQAVAPVDDHVNVAPAPLVTLVGLALIETVGCDEEAVTVTVADWLALPPVPVHVKT
jgi:hypothetical protein